MITLSVIPLSGFQCIIFRAELPFFEQKNSYQIKSESRITKSAPFNIIPEKIELFSKGNKKDGKGNKKDKK